MNDSENVVIGSRLLKSRTLELNVVSIIGKLQLKSSLAPPYVTSDLNITPQDIVDERKQAQVDMEINSERGDDGDADDDDHDPLEFVRVSLIHQNGVLEYLGTSQLIQNPSLRVSSKVLGNRLHRILVGSVEKPYNFADNGISSRMAPPLAELIVSDEEVLDEREASIEQGDAHESSNYDDDKYRRGSRHRNTGDQEEHTFDKGCRFTLKYLSIAEAEKFCSVGSSSSTDNPLLPFNKLVGASGQKAEALAWSRIREKALFRDLPLAVLEAATPVTGSDAFFIHFRIPLFLRRTSSHGKLETPLQGFKRVLSLIASARSITNSEKQLWEKRRKEAAHKMAAIEDETRKQKGLDNIYEWIRKLTRSTAEEDNISGSSSSTPQLFCNEQDDDDMKDIVNRVVSCLTPLPQGVFIKDELLGTKVEATNQAIEGDLLHIVNTIRLSRKTRLHSRIALESLVKLEHRYATFECIVQELQTLLEDRLSRRISAINEKRGFVENIQMGGVKAERAIGDNSSAENTRERGGKLKRNKLEASRVEVNNPDLNLRKRGAGTLELTSESSGGAFTGSSSELSFADIVDDAKKIHTSELSEHGSSKAEFNPPQERDGTQKSSSKVPNKSLRTKTSTSTGWINSLR